MMSGSRDGVVCAWDILRPASCIRKNQLNQNTVYCCVYASYIFKPDDKNSLLKFCVFFSFLFFLTF